MLRNGRLREIERFDHVLAAAAAGGGKVPQDLDASRMRKRAQLDRKCVSGVSWVVRWIRGAWQNHRSSPIYDERWLCNRYSVFDEVALAASALAASAFAASAFDVICSPIAFISAASPSSVLSGTENTWPGQIRSGSDI